MRCRCNISSFLRRSLLRRRTFVIFVIGIVTSIVYLTYQAMTLGRLGQELSGDYHRKRHNPRMYEAYQKADDTFLGQLPQLEEDHGIKIKGVRPEDLRFYIPTTRGNFRCLNQNEEFTFDRVNDEFCDCEDSSDEPSTAACPNGKFYCDFQPDHLLTSVYVVGEKVNDGYCDCCDGSDEWLNIKIPKHVQISEAKELKLGIDQVPCRNRCMDKGH